VNVKAIYVTELRSFYRERWKTIALHRFIRVRFDLRNRDLTHVLLENVLHVDVVALSRQEREKDHQTYEFE